MPLTPDEIEQERPRFEPWIRSAYAENADLSTVNGEYIERFTWCHWQGWIAAIESKRERVEQSKVDYPQWAKDIVEAIRDELDAIERRLR